jgi:hypothetical protein
MDDIQTLFNQLKDPDDSIRSRSINKLRKMGDKKAVKPILEMLSDKDWGVRADAIEALGELADNSIEDILIKYLDDENLIVKRETIYALGKIGSSKSIERIEQIAHSSYGELKTAAINTLEKMGHKPENTQENSELLIKVLNDTNSSTFDKRYAAEILGKRGETKAIDPLIKIVYCWEEAQDKAEWALSQMDKGVGEAILQLLENEYRLNNQQKKVYGTEDLLKILLNQINTNKFKKKEAINQLLAMHDFYKNKDDLPYGFLDLINECTESLGEKPALKPALNIEMKINNDDWYFCESCVKAVKSNICPHCKHRNLKLLTEPYSANVPDNLTQADIDNMWNKKISDSSERAYISAILILHEKELGRRKECEKLGINWKK